MQLKVLLCTILMIHTTVSHQLIQSGLQDHLTSVKIVVYSRDDVISFESKLPDIQ